jgi:cytochrome oxidase Cu insertion factor (SCO1/SenC/PrrC family)
MSFGRFFSVISLRSVSLKAAKQPNFSCQRWSSYNTGRIPIRNFSISTKPRRQDVLHKFSKLSPVNWKTFAFSIVCGGACLAYMYYVILKKEYEDEKQRKLTIGRNLIGGPWELVNHDGKLMSSNDFLGKWVLIYFGFTHCPDICPDEIEKMVEIINKIEKEKLLSNDIVGLFFTVDPSRDTPERVKKYLEEFSPKLIGFTGSKEQIDKVCKTFRVYHSEGPKDLGSDYIVDHTIIQYLMDPEGNFIDYYGQKRSANEVVDAIQLCDMKFESQKRKAKFFEGKEK